MSEKSIDCEGTNEIVCPHCGYEHRDSWELERDDGDTECHSCEKPFQYSRLTSVTYSSNKPTEAS